VDERGPTVDFIGNLFFALFGALVATGITLVVLAILITNTKLSAFESSFDSNFVWISSPIFTVMFALFFRWTWREWKRKEDFKAQLRRFWARIRAEENTR
jgi:hypothetical protein